MSQLDNSGIIQHQQQNIILDELELQKKTDASSLDMSKEQFISEILILNVRISELESDQRENIVEKQKQNQELVLVKILQDIQEQSKQLEDKMMMIKQSSKDAVVVILGDLRVANKNLQKFKISNQKLIDAGQIQQDQSQLEISTLNQRLIESNTSLQEKVRETLNYDQEMNIIKIRLQEKEDQSQELANKIDVNNHIANDAFRAISEELRNTNILVQNLEISNQNLITGKQVQSQKLSETQSSLEESLRDKQFYLQELILIRLSMQEKQDSCQNTQTSNFGFSAMDDELGDANLNVSILEVSNQKLLEVRQEKSNQSSLDIQTLIESQSQSSQDENIKDRLNYDQEITRMNICLNEKDDQLILLTNQTTQIKQSSIESIQTLTQELKDANKNLLNSQMINQQLILDIKTLSLKQLELEQELEEYMDDDEQDLEQEQELVKLLQAKEDQSLLLGDQINQININSNKNIREMQYGLGDANSNVSTLEMSNKQLNCDIQTLNLKINELNQALEQNISVEPIQGQDLIFVNILQDIQDQLQQTRDQIKTIKLSSNDAIIAIQVDLRNANKILYKLKQSNLKLIEAGKKDSLSSQIEIQGLNLKLIELNRQLEKNDWEKQNYQQLALVKLSSQENEDQSPQLVNQMGLIDNSLQETISVLQVELRDAYINVSNLEKQLSVIETKYNLLELQTQDLTKQTTVLNLKLDQFQQLSDYFEIYESSNQQIFQKIFDVKNKYRLIDNQDSVEQSSSHTNQQIQSSNSQLQIKQIENLIVLDQQHNEIQITSQILNVNDIRQGQQQETNF